MLDESASRAETDPFRTWFSLRWVSNAKQWRGQPIEHTKDYDLAVIEFDDQGWFQDIDQRIKLERFLSEKVEQNEDLLIVVFIHGWKHNAAAEIRLYNHSVVCFVTHALAKTVGAKTGSATERSLACISVGVA